MSWIIYFVLELICLSIMIAMSLLVTDFWLKLMCAVGIVIITALATIILVEEV